MHLVRGNAHAGVQQAVHGRAVVPRGAHADAAGGHIHTSLMVGCSQLIACTAVQLFEYLNVQNHRVLPEAWRSQRTVPWKVDNQPVAPGVDCAWLRGLWRRLLQFPALDALAAWALVPIQGNLLTQGHPSAQVGAAYAPMLEAGIHAGGCWSSGPILL